MRPIKRYTIQNIVYNNNLRETAYMPKNTEIQNCIGTLSTAMSSLDVEHEREHVHI